MLQSSGHLATERPFLNLEYGVVANEYNDKNILGTLLAH